MNPIIEVGAVLILVAAVALLGVAALVWAKAITAAVSTRLHHAQVDVGSAELRERMAERAPQPAAKQRPVQYDPDVLKQAVIDAREHGDAEPAEDFEETDTIQHGSMYQHPGKPA